MGQGRIQDADVKSASDLTGAGATIASLINDTKIYVTANGLNKQLSTAITNGDLSGGGSKNYLSTYNGNTGNGNFEQNATTGWSLFNTTLTSGIPTGSITAGASSITTFNIVSSGQLAGKYSLQTASSAAWSAGHGFLSDAYTIDIEDQAKVLTFKAYYEAVSGSTNINFSGTSSNTFAVYIYDVTNSAWIQPTGVYGITQDTGVGYVTGTFQSTSNSTQYRLAIIAVNASAGAVTMYWDDFSVGPQTVLTGVPATDWQSYTPTFGGIGTPTNVSVFYKRIGDTLFVSGSAKCGTTAASAFTISLPTGLTIDTTKETTANLQALGQLMRGSGTNAAAFSTTQFGPYILFNDSSDNAHIFLAGAISSSVYSKNNGNDLFSSGDNLSFWFSVPIAGWSSNVQFSNDTETRIVSAIYYKTSSSSVTAATQINFDGQIKDTHGAVTTGANWRFSAPVSGDYQVEVFLNASTTSNYVSIYKNGSAYNTIGYVSSNDAIAQCSGLVTLNAGDYIDVRPSGTGSVTGGAATSTISKIAIFKLAGPSVIAVSESVEASYYVSSNQSVTASNPINFDTKIIDTHGAVTTGASWKFTAPISGLYSVMGSGSSTTAGQFSFLYKNGSAYMGCGAIAGAINSMGIISAYIRLNAGDYIDIRQPTTLTVSGGTLGNTTGDPTSNITIVRVGN